MEKITLTWTTLTKLSKEIVNSLSEAAGVYRLSYKDEDNYYVFYTDKSANIKQSLLNHLDEQNNPCIAIRVKKSECAFRYALTSDENAQKAAVFQVYSHYQPSCNEAQPEKCDDVEVNIA